MAADFDPCGSGTLGTDTLGASAPDSSLNPTQGSIATVGQTPTVSAGVHATPTQGSIATAGQTPTLSFAAFLGTAVQGSIVTAGQTPAYIQGFAGTSAQGSIAIAGQTPAHATGFEGTSVQGSIATAGQTPSQSQYVFHGTPIQGSIATAGQSPTYVQGFAGTASIGSILTSGSTPSIASANITGRGFTQFPVIVATPEYPNTITGGTFVTTPAIYGGAVATGYGFKTLPTITVFADQTAYITGQGFTTTPSIVAVSVSNAGITGRGFASNAEIFGGAVVTGRTFATSFYAAAIAPETANILGAGFTTAPIITGYAPEIANITGRGFVSELARATITGTGFATHVSIVGEFTTAYAEAFVMNLLTRSVSRYQNYPFKHIAKIDGVYYGVADDGLYELTGELDGATAVNGTIWTNDDDLSVFNSKNIPYMYLNGDDDYSVTPVVDSVEQPTFSSGFSGRRVKMARGSKGRYWYFKIAGVQALQGLEYLPEGLSRRVK